MSEIFIAHKVSVTVQRLEKSVPARVNLNNTIGLAFPVAIFSTYPLVWDFVKSLPQANGTQIFMVDTCGGSSFGGVIGQMKSVLAKIGYNPIGAKEIVMPENVFYIESGEVNRKKIEKGLKEAEKYAEEIIAGKTKWRRIPILSWKVYIFSKFLFWLAGLKIHQKMFHLKVQKEKCTKCGLCARLCPVKNIEINEYPAHQYKCQYCMRCAGFCPTGAIPAVFNYKKVPYRAPGAHLSG
jgi:NAD-dependent dihydropyrimidine dehydrogenase PreA subunit